MISKYSLYKPQTNFLHRLGSYPLIAEFTMLPQNMIISNFSLLLRINIVYIWPMLTVIYVTFFYIHYYCSQITSLYELKLLVDINYWHFSAQ